MSPNDDPTCEETPASEFAIIPTDPLTGDVDDETSGKLDDETSGKLDDETSGANMLPPVIGMNMPEEKMDGDPKND